jgi:tape measure domain-containing protein
LRVRDAQRWSRDMRDAAASTRSLGTAGRSAGQAMTWSQSQGHRFRQSMLVMGQTARWAGFGLGIAGAGAVKMGIEFNATMEQNEVALDQFLRSGERTNAMLDELFQIAAKTPFEFKDVTTAARKFLAFGFTARQTTRYLMGVGNAVAGIGGGNDEIQRAIIALGQMQAKGKVMGQELLQLTELGIPAYQILKQELGLTSDQMKRVGDEGISARKGIEAIMAGMDKRFAGAAERQAQTMAGRWSTFKDYFRQTMGALTRPLFDIIRKTILPAFINIMPEVQKEAPRILRGFFLGLSGDTGAVGKAGITARKVGDALRKAFGVAKGAVEDFLEAIKPAQPFFENVMLPLAKGLAIGIGVTLVGAFKLAIILLRGFSEVLGFLGRIAEPFEPIITGIGMALSLVLGGAVLRALSYIPRLGVVFRVAGAGLNFLGNVIGKAVIFFGRFLGSILRIFGPMRRFGQAIANGIRNPMNDTLGFLAALGPRMFNAGVAVAKALVRGIKNVFAAGIGFAADVGKTIANFVINLLNDAIPNKIPGPGPLPDINLPDNPIPSFARGGRMHHSGWAIVGEEGPELARFPSGTEFTPSHALRGRYGRRGVNRETGSYGVSAEALVPAELGAVRSYAGMGDDASYAAGRGPQIIQLVVAGRVLAEVVADEAADRKARR